jgi:hypothetical protein
MIYPESALIRVKKIWQQQGMSEFQDKYNINNITHKCQLKENVGSSLTVLVKM